MLKTGIYVLTWLKQTPKNPKEIKNNNKKKKQLRKPPEKTKKKEKISIGFVMYRLYVSWGSSPCGLDLRVQSIFSIMKHYTSFPCRTK